MGRILLSVVSFIDEEAVGPAWRLGRLGCGADMEGCGKG